MTKGGQEKETLARCLLIAAHLSWARPRLRDAGNTKEQQTLYSHVNTSLLWAKLERIPHIRMDGKDVLAQTH